MCIFVGSFAKSLLDLSAGCVLSTVKLILKVNVCDFIILGGLELWLK